MVAYSLQDDEIVRRDTTHREFMTARATVKARWDKNPADYHEVHCWVCHPSNGSLLSEDGLILLCLDCGRWFYNGIDLVEEPEPERENEFDTGTPGPPRPMRGIFSHLSEEQKQKALTHSADGEVEESP